MLVNSSKRHDAKGVDRTTVISRNLAANNPLRRRTCPRLVARGSSRIVGVSSREFSRRLAPVG